ncbi:MAG: 3-isopropylmalate dehydratase small subunit [Methanomicrobiales archaeon]|nr:3-isopropylmalate dehydratase small subunit [Methanomicrobiales archaeon]
MRVWKFGDNVDTDAIIPGRFLIINDARELAQHAFQGTRDEFRTEVAPGDVIVAGRNFGCGSSREHAPLALSGAGVTVIVAASFARIFYRNAINLGILPMVCHDVGSIRDGEEVRIDLNKGVIETGGKTYTTEPVPPFLRAIFDAGGLVPYARALREVS